MDLAPLQSRPPLAGTQTKDSPASAISSDFETFLRMLTVQMQNQDPLNPTDPSDFALQLATFSGVEQQVLTNDLLQSLTVQSGTSGLSQMAGWVGKEARAAVPARFDGSPITIAPNPAPQADRAELVVRDATGLVVQRMDLPLGLEPMDWAGVSAQGMPFPQGTYSFSVVSLSGGEVMQEDPAEIYARVTEVRSEGGEMVLILTGGARVPASEVSALRSPGS